VTSQTSRQTTLLRLWQQAAFSRDAWYTACEPVCTMESIVLSVTPGGRQRRATYPHLSSASSSEFPDSIILCWASLCCRESAGVAPIRTMASPTCRPHLAARLPGVTYNREETVTQCLLGRPALLEYLPGALPFSAAAAAEGQRQLKHLARSTACNIFSHDSQAHRYGSWNAPPPRLIKYRNPVWLCGWAWMQLHGTWAYTRACAHYDRVLIKKFIHYTEGTGSLR